jgi:hypothetical protein
MALSMIYGYAHKKKFPLLSFYHCGEESSEIEGRFFFSIFFIFFNISAHTNYKGMQTELRRAGLEQLLNKDINALRGKGIKKISCT